MTLAPNLPGRLVDRVKFTSMCSRSPTTMITSCNKGYSTSSMTFEGRRYYTMINNNDLHKCANYKSISMVAHAGKILLKIIARRFSDYSRLAGILPKQQSSFD